MADKVPMGKTLSDEKLKKIMDELTSPEKIKETIKKANERWKKVVDPEVADLLETTQVIN